MSLARPLSWHWHVAFWLSLASWTWLLVKPNPVPELVLGTLDSFFDPTLLKFLLAKTLHLSVYVVFSVYAAALVATHRRRRWAWGLLILHGILSEIAQHYGDLYFQTNRTGRLRDVIIDTFGVLIGAQIATWWLRQPSCQVGPDQPPPSE